MVDWHSKIATSVLAVPPLARNDDLTVSKEQNLKLINYLSDGGIKTLLYGGNANFYHIGISEYRELLEFLLESVSNDTWLIPSISPMFGPIMDQGQVLKDLKIGTAMVLPATFPATQEGVEKGIRHFCDKVNIPVVLYLKNVGYLEPDQVARLIEENYVSVIKYAVVRKDPYNDALLSALIQCVNPDRIISGIGEQPAICHMSRFGLAGFTSGCVCIAPGRSMEMLRSLQSGHVDRAEGIRTSFKPLESLRNSHGPIPVLHEAVRLAGVADTGPMLPLMTNLDKDLWPEVEKAAKDLVAITKTAGK